MHLSRHSLLISHYSFEWYHIANFIFVSHPRFSFTECIMNSHFCIFWKLGVVVPLSMHFHICKSSHVSRFCIFFHVFFFGAISALSLMHVIMQLDLFLMTCFRFSRSWHISNFEYSHAFLLYLFMHFYFCILLWISPFRVNFPFCFSPSLFFS